MVLKGILSPPRSRCSPKIVEPDGYATGNLPKKQRTPAGNRTIEPPKPAIASSRRQTHATNPLDVQIRKRYTQVSGKITGRKTGQAANIKPSSLPTVTINVVQNSSQPKIRRYGGIDPPSMTARSSQPRKATSLKEAGETTSDSQTDIPSNKGQEVVDNNSDGNTLPHSLSDSHVYDQVNHTLGNGMEGRNSNRFDNAWNSQTYGDQSTDSEVGLVQLLEKRSGVMSSQTSLPENANILIYDEVGSDAKKQGSQNNAARVFKVYRDIASHRQGTLSITSYFTKLNTLWDELASYSDQPKCSCSAMTKISEHGEREKVMQFLMGLNDSYSTLSGQILHMEPFPTIERTCFLILREEKQRELVASIETVTTKLMHNTCYQKDQSESNASSKNTSDDPLDVFPDEYGLESQRAIDATLATSCNSGVQVPSILREQILLIDLNSPVS